MIGSDSGSYDSWPSDDNYQQGNGTNTSGGNIGGGSTGGGTSGGGTSGGNSSASYNTSKAVDYLVSHAYPTYIKEKCGNCAKAVREALEAGGLSTMGHPTSACDYDTFLPRIGFHVVSKENYSPQKGDIIVLEAVEGHTYGHIAMYSGSKWISDFVQSDMWGGSAYRNKAEYNIFRR